MVVDVDIKDDKYKDPSSLGLPDTTVVKTGSGGMHYYYTYKQEVNNKARINNLDIDIRAEGGYILAPPSSNEKGDYTYIKKTNTLPDFPLSFIKPNTTDTNPNQGGLLNLPQDAFEPYTKHTPAFESFEGISSGGRNDAMMRFTASLLPKVHPMSWDSLAWPQVQQANQKNTPPLPATELRTTFDSICAKERITNQERFHDKKPSPVQVQQAKTKEEIAKKPPLTITPLSQLLSLPQIEGDDIIHKMIPAEAITAITAETGIGKSILIWEMARHIATGTPFLDQDQFKTSKHRVLIVDQEMSEREIRKRSHAILRDYPTADIFFMRGQNFKIDEEKTYNELLDIIKQNQIGVVILDTFSTIHTKEESSRDGMMIVNEKMMEIINETGCAIVYIHHHRKQQDGTAFDNNSARGSSEIMAKVASHLLFKRKKGGGEDVTEDGEQIMEREFVLSQKKSRGVDSFDSIIIKSTYNYNHQRTTWDFLANSDEKTIASDKASDSILQFLEDRQSSEWTSNDIISALAPENIGKSAITKALKDLRESNAIKYKKGKHNRLLYQHMIVDISSDLSAAETIDKINKHMNPTLI